MTLLCTPGLCPANQVKPGQGPVAAIGCTKPRFRQHSRQPYSRTGPSLFYLISPEAAQLTGLHTLSIILKLSSIKKSA